MSPGVVAKIFKEFHFRSLTPKSSKNLIYKNIINTAFNAIIITSKYGKDKHIEWAINSNLEENLPKIQKMVADYAKKVLRDVAMESVLIECEDSDDEL